MVEFNLHRKPEQQTRQARLLDWAGQHWLKLAVLLFGLHLLARQDAMPAGSRSRAENLKPENRNETGRQAKHGSQEEEEFSIGQAGRMLMLVEDRPGILPDRD